MNGASTSAWARSPSAAGVGRGTLFRNFPSKEHLIAAIVVERMGDAAESARSLLTAPDPGEALFAFLEEVVGRQNVDRALFEAVGDEFMANEDIRAAYAGLVSALDDLIARAQQAGAVRDDIGSLDALMMIKGACQAATSFAHLDSQIGQRQLDLVRAALSPAGRPAAAARRDADVRGPRPGVPGARRAGLGRARCWVSRGRPRRVRGQPVEGSSSVSAGDGPGASNGNGLGGWGPVAACGRGVSRPR